MTDSGDRAGARPEEATPDRSVRTRLSYLVPTDSKPVYYASKGGADAELRISAQFE